MKRKQVVLISSVLIIGILSGCNASPSESINTSSSTVSIDVEHNDLAYGQEEQDTSTSSSKPISSSNTSSPDNSSSSIYVGNDGIVSVQPDWSMSMPDKTPTPSTSGNNTPTNKDEDPAPYNTTITDEIEKNVSFGKMTVIEWTEETNGGSYQDSGDTISVSGRDGEGFKFVFGDTAYGHLIDVSFSLYGAEYVNDPLIIDNTGDNSSDISFKFVGAGHFLTDLGESSTAQFYVELEKDGRVLTSEEAGKISSAGAYSIAAKSFACHKDDFKKVSSEGYGYNTDRVESRFQIIKGSREEWLALGTPIEVLTDMLGKGTEFKATTTFGNAEPTEEEYVAYKTEDYTLIVGSTHYNDEDIEKSSEMDENAPKEVNLITTIILVRNQAQLPEKPNSST